VAIARPDDLSSETRRSFDEEFIDRASGTGVDSSGFRSELVSGYAEIHRSIRCAHQEAEALLLAEAILTLEVEGPIIELGVFKGGATAKLSLPAAATGRRLYVCDSFAGLPEPSPFDRFHDLITGRTKQYAAGDYAGTLEEVQRNVAAWGSPEVCEFVPGMFRETLPMLDIRPALVFLDVDLVESARTCLLHLWPRLCDGGQFFTHEASSITFLRGLTDPAWWQTHFRRCPPLLLGAGFGFGPLAKNLAYFAKDA
jgi:hypothetical protein